MVDNLKELNERAIGELFIEFYNSQHGTGFVYDSRPEVAPDLVYRDGESTMVLEVAMAYYDEADAKFKWLRARKSSKAPRSWSGTNPTDSLVASVNAVIADHSEKRYGPGVTLVVHVAPGVTEAERFESRLTEIQVPPGAPFAAVYVTGDFGMSTHSTGGYRCWRLDKVA